MCHFWYCLSSFITLHANIGRAAALAANAAITAQSNQKNDEEPVLVDDEGSCSNEDASIEGDGTIVEQQPPSLLTFKRKKKMPMTCTSTTTTTAAVEDDKKSKGKVQVNRDEEEEDKDVGASNNNNGNSTFMFHKVTVFFSHARHVSCWDIEYWYLDLQKHTRVPYVSYLLNYAEWF